MEKKVNVPQKGAARKWANKLEELGRQPPPKGLMEKINKDEIKKVAASAKPLTEMDK
jgi:hypothetical protein